MAFSSGRGGGSSIDETEFSDPPIVAEINITPLTDIFLVLLIIFMVTSSVLSQMGIQVQLPQSSHATSANDSSGVLVTVTKRGEIFVNGSQIQEENLRAALTEKLAKSKDKTVVLEGDRQAMLGIIVKVMDEGKKAGATKFAIATQSEEK